MLQRPVGKPPAVFICIASGDVCTSGVLRPLHPPGDFCLGKSHQNRSAPKGSPAYAGPSRLRRPQEVRIRRIPAPDAHVRDPSRTLSGSTSAFPRRSLAYGTEEQRCRGFAVGPRMARLSDASLWPRAWKGARQDDARGPPGQGCPVGTPPRQRRVRAGGVAPSGMPFLSPISLGTQRNRLDPRGRNPVRICRRKRLDK